MNDPDLQPKKTKAGITTFCNIHVFNVCRDLGYKYFWHEKQVRPFMANEIVAYMDNHPELFSKMYSPVKASEMACNGYLVIAGIKDTPHGHVAPISPSGILEVSGKWGGAQVPHCYNVGKENKLCGINFAFGEMPNFYICL